MPCWLLGARALTPTMSSLGYGRHTQNCAGVYNKINHFWDQPARTNKTWLLQRTPPIKWRGVTLWGCQKIVSSLESAMGKQKNANFWPEMLGRGRHTQNCIQFDSKPSLLKSLRRLHGQGPSLAFVKPLTFQIQRHREAMWSTGDLKPGRKKKQACASRCIRQPLWLRHVTCW